MYKESYSVRLCKEIRQRAGPFVVFLDLSETAEDQLNEVTKAALAIYREVLSVAFPFRLHCELVISSQYFDMASRIT